MIYCILNGGLGNQLFQFGAALRLARGDTSRIRLVISKVLPNFGYRLPEFLGDKVLPGVATADEVRGVTENLDGKDVVGVIQDNERGVFIDQPALDVDYREMCKVAVIDGYLQSSKNALAVRAFVLRHLPDIELYRGLVIAPPETVVAHYRLGDYRRADVQREIGVMNPSYLDRAVDEADRTSSVEHVTLFTDDKALVDLYGDNRHIECVVGGSDLDVFRRMLCARRLIIANSTYSLMAAYLSPNVERIYRPLYWTRKVLDDDLTTSDGPFDVVKLENTFLPIT
jgi:hypothetical protein